MIKRMTNVVFLFKFKVCSPRAPGSDVSRVLIVIYKHKWQLLIRIFYTSSFKVNFCRFA